MNPKKALFFDIDGTLVYENSGKLIVHELNLRAIKELREKGYKTFIATGRTQDFVPDVVNNLPMDGFVTANGSVVSVDKKIVYEKLFPKQYITDVINFCEKNNHSWMFEGKFAYVASYDSEPLEYFSNSVVIDKNKIAISDDIYKETIYNALVLGRDIDSNALSKCLGDGCIAAAHPNHGYVDCYLASHTKADGIDMIVNHFDLHDYELYAFGDGNNDLEMFGRVDVAVAMDNATDLLKEKATLITKTNYNAGVYFGLVKLGLI